MSLRTWVEKTGFTVSKIRQQPEKPITREDFFNLYFSQVNPKTFYFVQIGAHNGKYSDPIHSYVTKYRLSGTAVEPQPDVFKQLQETYAGFPVKCVNAAVGKEDGVRSLYVVKESAITAANFEQMTGIASFDRAMVERNLTKKIPLGEKPSEYIDEISVPAVSFESLVQGIEKIDLLQIDTEGYDWEILKMVDIKKYAPRIINFESTHLSVADRHECETWLEVNDYRWFRNKGDTCAYLLK